MVKNYNKNNSNSDNENLLTKSGKIFYFRNLKLTAGVSKNLLNVDYCVL